jgi:HSP20 family protein
MSVATDQTLFPARAKDPIDPSQPVPEFQAYLRPQATRLRVHETVWHPPTDVYESEDSYHVMIELGGMASEEIEVVVEEGSLAFKGRRPDTCQTNKIRYRQAEIKYGLFEVRLRLPEDVDVSAISAKYHNGFLQAVLPKRPHEAIQSTRVTITIG